MAEVYKIQFDAKSPDLNALLQIQKRNIEALSEVSKIAVEGMQSILQRQGEILSEVTKDTAEIMQELSKEGSPEEKAARHADLTKHAYERTVKYWHELADLIGSSSKEASEIIHDRVSSSLTELKSAVNNKRKTG